MSLIPSDALYALSKCLNDAVQELSAKPEQPMQLDAADTLGKVLLAARALVQQTRATYFLEVMDAPQSEALACIADVEKAAALYVSWAKALLATVAPSVRKVAKAPCTRVVSTLKQLLDKAASRTLKAPDLALLEHASDALEKLPVRGTDAARGVLLKSEQLLADALDEAIKSIAEAQEGDPNEDGDEDEDEDEEQELWGQPLFSGPTRTVLEAAGALLRIARDAGLAGCAEDKVAGMLGTCAQAASAQADALMVAMHEDDEAGVGSYAASVGKVVGKLHELLAQRCGLADDATLAKAHAAGAEAVRRLVAAAAGAAGDTAGGGGLDAGSSTLEGPTAQMSISGSGS